MKTALLSLIACAALAMPANGVLIISQYYEGTGSDKWIEIYNTDSTSVDLGTGNFRVGLWSNANREGWKTSVAPNTQVALSGTIAGNSSILIRNASTVNPSYAVGAANAAVNFNGDDSFGIWQSTDTTFASGEMIDVFGATANLFFDTSYSRIGMTPTTSDFSSSLWQQFTLAEVASAVSGSNERLGDFTPVPEPTTWAGIIFGVIFCGTQVVRRLRGSRAA